MKILSLMSGGRDSLLATAMMVEAGHDVTPFFCDNGHIEGQERVYDTIAQIDEIYGSMISTKTVIAKTAMTAHKYMQSEWYMTSEELAQKYPHMQTYQVHCLGCRTAMYVHAIAYCQANEIEAICDGARWAQGFFVDRAEFITRLEQLANPIKVLTPVFDVGENFERKRMLSERGLPTKTFEPQCFLGAQLKEPLDTAQITSLENFFDKELLPQLKANILSLVPVYKHR